MNLIDKPGVYEVSEELYHADPVCAPSLSASVAKVLLHKSPRHAWVRHPRLNPDFQEENKAVFDVGKAAHALILGEERSFVIIEADDWRTKDAKAARDAAYAAGKTPILAHHWAEVLAMAEAARAQLEQHEDASDAFTDGEPDKTLVWQEGNVWCRCRLDWTPRQRRRHSTFYDYKSTSGTANPEVISRQFFEMGYDVQATFYRRGIRKLLDVGDPQFQFVVQETEPPYALSVIGLAPEVLDRAEKKVDEALRWWGMCLAADSWPGYPRRTCYIEPLPFQEKRWLDREARYALEMEGKGDSALFETMLRWQAPRPLMEKTR